MWSDSLNWLNSLDWSLEIVFAGRVVMATLLGAIVGLERERHQQDAGVRTYGAVALGACMFSLVSAHIPGADPTRIAANVVTGMGFLGAGVIFRAENRTIGLTTAATLWATASIGMAVGFGMFPLAVLAAAIIFAVLASHHLPCWNRKRRVKHYDAPSRDEH